MLFKNNSRNKIFVVIREFLLYFFIVLSLSFSAVPIKFFSIIKIFPNISSILIFYFMVLERKDLSYFAIFIFGLLFDIFNNIPLGFTSLMWLISVRFIKFIRTHLYTPDVFMVAFRDFVIFDLSNIIIEWILFSLFYKILYPALNLIIQFALDILFFGILYRLLEKTKKWFD